MLLTFISTVPYRPACFSSLRVNSSIPKNLSRPRPRACLPSPKDTPTSLVSTPILLSLVPFLWGTYGISVKYLYLQSIPMPLSLINLSSFFFAYISLLPSSLFSSEDSSLPSASPLPTLLSGIELGIYLYFGSVLNLLALEYTSASRCAFFCQLTTLFVPIANLVLNRPPTNLIIFSAFLSLSGAFILSSPISAAPNPGDLFAIASAGLYSIHVLRLDRIQRREAGPVVLVQGKCLAQTMLSLLAVIGTTINGDDGVVQYVSAFGSMSQSERIAAVAWSMWIGVGTTALATWAQVVGQERVGGSKAAVVYASQPVWAVALACGLGLESLTPMELLGGGVIVGAGMLAAIGEMGSKQT